MTSQLAEAVRIDLRGEGILNSKSEYNRCRVPRLKVDLEGWKAEQKSEENASHDEDVNYSRDREAENSLQERDVKRKTPDLPDPDTRRSKKRKLELLSNWGEASIHLEDDEMDNLPEGWWKAVDELNSSEANLRTSGRSNTCGTSMKEPVGVTTILDTQGQDPVNTDPDKASEAYEGLGPTPDLLRQTHEPKSSKAFKFKKRGKISSKENIEIQRTHRSLFSWINNPLPLPSVKNDAQVEKDDLTEEGVEVVGEEMDIEMEVDRPEYEEWVMEWLTESIREIETSRKYCSSLVEEIVHGAVVLGKRKQVTS